MSLRIEKHPELDKLSDYFRKVEELAKRMGVDVDDLVATRPFGSLTVHTPTRDQQERLSRQRVDVFVGETPTPDVVKAMTLLLQADPENMRKEE